MVGLYKKAWEELYGEARNTLVVQPRLRAIEIIKHRIKKGRMRREACAVCDEKKTEPHWPDYGRALDVLWFCKKHHVEFHKYQALEWAYT